MMTFHYEVEGVALISRTLERFTRGVKDVSPAWHNIVSDFRQVERMQFASSGSRKASWAQLSPATLRRKKSNTILVDSGSLRDSLVSGTGLAITEIKPLELRLGTRHHAAKFHQRGTSRMPQRRVIDPTLEDKRRWTRYIHRYLVELFGQGLGRYS